MKFKTFKNLFTHKGEQDYSNEVHLVHSLPLRYLLLTVGTLSWLLGILGIFLPVLPTTPFLLLTALCYSKSSVIFYNFLLNNRIFGRYIRSWQKDKSIPMKVKIIAILFLAVTIGTSIIFFVKFVPAKILIGLIGLCVSWYILKQPTRN